MNRFLGILVLQYPDAEGDASEAGGLFGRLGASARMQDLARGFILPAADVLKATKRALDSGKAGK